MDHAGPWPFAFTGCSSIWGNSSPSTPYTVNAKGQGPAWSNSLFEDNAEFGYGMLLAQKAIRGGLKTKVESVMASENASEEVKAACQEWLDTYNSGVTNGAATDKLVAALEGCDCDVCKEMCIRDRYGLSSAGAKNVGRLLLYYSMCGREEAIYLSQ